MTTKEEKKSGKVSETSVQAEETKQPVTTDMKREKQETTNQPLPKQGTGSDDIDNRVSELVQLYEERDKLNAELSVINASLKPVRRARKRIHRLPALVKPTRTERKKLKVEKAEISRQLLNLFTLIEEKEISLGKFSKSSVSNIKERTLYDKANSAPYLKKSGHFIKKKVLGVINRLIAAPETKQTVIRLRILAQDVTEEGNILFEETLGATLRETEQAAYILSSGKLKNSLYPSVKKTLQEWDPDQEEEIKKLLVPEK